MHWHVAQLGRASDLLGGSKRNRKVVGSKPAMPLHTPAGRPIVCKCRLISPTNEVGPGLLSCSRPCQPVMRNGLLNLTGDEMEYSTVIKVFQSGEFVGELRADQIHLASGQQINWVFEPQHDTCFGIDELRSIADKMESLEPEI